MISEGTIVALSTASGTGAIALIRLSGSKAISLTDQVFKTRSGEKLIFQKSHTVHLGEIRDGKSIIDEVLVSVFKNPNSYTGEDVVEISCHGSPYIQQQIIKILIDKGAITAKAGEFTLRAFMNGKMDLSQAEAVADLISSENEASHQLAMQQMRGGFSNEIKNLRQELLNFASLIELELDFAEEDVAFADRKELENLIFKIQSVLKQLLDSFAMGNVIKKGVPIAIVGPPNVGKSTLLNCLLNEDKAIISDIAGTTRDSIEDEITLDGICFRFIDTAGIRDTQDTIEQIGIKKTFDKIELAAFVLNLVDSKDYQKNKSSLLKDLQKFKKQYPEKKLLVVFNKEDQIEGLSFPETIEGYPVLLISAKMNSNIDQLIFYLTEHFQLNPTQNQSIITNSRHYGALSSAQKEVLAIQNGLRNGLSGDLLAIDLRQALYHLGEITGEVTNDELLGNIFENFCIGK
ncbi:MAG: tRNA uridine-5-carboxymethylaminomethyl(34) synthesis GTPase MnmE [Flavobacteriales bacterium]|nr:tRNA uridine-5-carboxymethylaminomethyl(34) synthesis GTPase MnmE [Candidatus Arcticimaribacter sp.]|tara:strand:- start:616 stop:1998 length:1383 start_codon:yes stop_codon:yes gene_type:complete